MTAEEMIEEVSELLCDSTKYVCTRKKNDKPCTAQHEDEVDNEGRPVFYYATECRIVESFCPACLAYWHVAVARNCLFNYARTEAFRKAGR